MGFYIGGYERLSVARLQMFGKERGDVVVSTVHSTLTPSGTIDTGDRITLKASHSDTDARFPKISVVSCVSSRVVMST